MAGGEHSACQASCGLRLAGNEQPDGLPVFLAALLLQNGPCFALVKKEVVRSACITQVKSLALVPWPLEVNLKLWTQYWEETASSGLGGGNAANPAEAVMELDEHLDEGERTPEQEALDVLLEALPAFVVSPPGPSQDNGHRRP